VTFAAVFSQIAKTGDSTECKIPINGNNNVPVDETMVNSKIANVLRVSKKIEQCLDIKKKCIFAVLMKGVSLS